jgi:hypothetical protein
MDGGNADNARSDYLPGNAKGNSGLNRGGHGAHGEKPVLVLKKISRQVQTLFGASWPELEITDCDLKFSAS